MQKQVDFNFTQGPISESIISEIILMDQTFEIGANFIFIGKVRADKQNEKIVKEIEYSAYLPLAEEVMQEIIETIKSKFKVLSIRIIHSLGIVKSGQQSLLVFIGSPHRIQAFSAVQETVELIKAKLPVWKKEIFEDDSYIWPSNK